MSVLVLNIMKILEVGYNGKLWKLKTLFQKTDLKQKMKKIKKYHSWDNQKKSDYQSRKVNLYLIKAKDTNKTKNIFKKKKQTKT